MVRQQVEDRVTDLTTKKKSNQDVVNFEHAFALAILAALVTIAFVSIRWRNAYSDYEGILFITPLEELCVEERVESEQIAEIREVCEDVGIATNASIYHPVSVVELAGIAALWSGLVAAAIAIVLESISLFRHPDGKSRFSIYFQIVGKLIAALVLVSFVKLMFTVFALLGGLTTETPTEALSRSVAIGFAAGIALMMFMFSYIWSAKLQLTGISGIAAGVFVASLALAIVFTTGVWSGAFSLLGVDQPTKSALLLADGSGSTGLFRFTFVALGFLLIAYSALLVRVFVQITKVFTREILFAFALSFVVGILTMFVGLFSLDKHKTLHNLGAYGGVIVTWFMILVWTMIVFPHLQKFGAVNYLNRIKYGGIGIVITMFIIGILFLIKWLTTLEAEFYILLLTLISVHAFALYVEETRDDLVQST